MMVHRHACEECGTHVDLLTREGDLYCECGEELEFSGTVGVVYGSGNDIRPQVRELVELFRAKQEEYETPATSRAYGKCADELEELIEP